MNMQMKLTRVRHVHIQEFERSRVWLIALINCTSTALNKQQFTGVKNITIGIINAARGFAK